jgi:hypothetical protein
MPSAVTSPHASGAPPRDDKESGPSRCLTSERGKRAPSGEVGLLGGIVGVARTDDVSTEPPDRRLGSTHYGGERAPVPVAGIDEKLAELIHRVDGNRQLRFGVFPRDGNFSGPERRKLLGGWRGPPRDPPGVAG